MAQQGLVAALAVEMLIEDFEEFICMFTWSMSYYESVELKILMPCNLSWIAH
jgi:hypothetical protein